MSTDPIQSELRSHCGIDIGFGLALMHVFVATPGRKFNAITLDVGITLAVAVIEANEIDLNLAHSKMTSMQDVLAPGLNYNACAIMTSIVPAFDEIKPPSNQNATSTSQTHMIDTCPSTPRQQPTQTQINATCGTLGQTTIKQQPSPTRNVDKPNPYELRSKPGKSINAKRDATSTNHIHLTRPSQSI